MEVQRRVYSGVVSLEKSTDFAVERERVSVRQGNNTKEKRQYRTQSWVVLYKLTTESGIVMCDVQSTPVPSNKTSDVIRVVNRTVFHPLVLYQRFTYLDGQLVAFLGLQLRIPWYSSIPLDSSDFCQVPNLESTETFLTQEKGDFKHEPFV